MLSRMRWLAVALLLLACSKTTKEERAEATRLEAAFTSPTTIDDLIARFPDVPIRDPATDWGFGYERASFGRRSPCTAGSPSEPWIGRSLRGRFSARGDLTGTRSQRRFYRAIQRH